MLKSDWSFFVQQSMNEKGLHMYFDELSNYSNVQMIKRVTN